MSDTADELVELIRGRIHAEFDGECHLTDTEAHRIANFLSEADQREKDARRVALGDAAEAIFVMGAWSPHYEKLTPNTFDEGTSAAYEIVREMQGEAENASQSEAAQ